MNSPNGVLWLTGGISALLFAVLVILSEFWLKADGLSIFDSRLSGYSFAEAKAYLTALTSEQNTLYRRVFHKLDTVFPAFLTFTMVVLIWRGADGLDLFLRSLGTVLPVVYLALDYTENWSVAQMLQAGPGLPEALANQASGATVGKWISLMISFIVTIWAWRVAPNKQRG